ncbi:MAG TPA: hypothetical protein VM734_24420 [Kofleriaceae bacterium]|nr:hypothetical protein [Kofleriaceae bacterium]
MLNKDEELKDRIAIRKHELLAKLSELKADGRHGAAEARDKIKHTLAEIEETVKDGWDNLSDAARDKLNKLIDRI